MARLAFEAWYGTTGRWLYWALQAVMPPEWPSLPKSRTQRRPQEPTRSDETPHWFVRTITTSSVPLSVLWSRQLFSVGNSARNPFVHTNQIPFRISVGRAGLINGALGGAALGGAGGLAWYYTQFEGIDGISQRARQAIGQGKAKVKEAESSGQQLIKEARGEKSSTDEIAQKAQNTFDEGKAKAKEAELRGRQLLQDVKAKGKQELDKRT